MLICYIVWGDNESYHLEAAFSIISFLSRGRAEILVMTDRPEFYRCFGDGLRVVEVAPETFAEWTGKHRFPWRVKIKGLERLIKLHPGRDLLYLDTDTFPGGRTAVHA